MKTDSIFYRLLQTAPSVFFELIGNTDPRTSAYTFGSQEVKQANFTIDGIFLPPLRMPQCPIYFVEAQGYRDKKGENFGVAESEYEARIYPHPNPLPGERE